MEYNVISADNHILEPRDLFATASAEEIPRPGAARGPGG